MHEEAVLDHQTAPERWQGGLTSGTTYLVTFTSKPHLAGS